MLFGESEGFINIFMFSCQKNSVFDWNFTDVFNLAGPINIKSALLGTAYRWQAINPINDEPAHW